MLFKRKRDLFGSCVSGALEQAQQLAATVANRLVDPRARHGYSGGRIDNKKA